MKLNIVKNSEGKIVAACEICNDADAVIMKPILEDGQSMEEIDAPEDCFERFDELCEEWEKTTKC